MNNLGTGISEEFLAEVERIRAGIGWKQFEKKYGVGRQTFHSWKGRRVANRQILADMVSAIWEDESYGRSCFERAYSALPRETQQALRPLLPEHVELQAAVTNEQAKGTTTPPAAVPPASHADEIDAIHTPVTRDSKIASSPEMEEANVGATKLAANAHWKRWLWAGLILLPSGLVAVISVAFATRDVDTPVVTFNDKFEGAVLSDFWQKTEDVGRIITQCDEIGLDESHSVKFVSGEGGIVKRIALFHEFPRPVYGRVSVFIYDTGADVKSTNYISLIASNTPQRTMASVGTKDYDLGPEQGGTYIYQNFTDTSEKPSDVDRTRDWHRFTIISRPGYLNLLVDGKELYRGPEGIPFDRIDLEMRAPEWRPPWHAYFDDFIFVPYEPSSE